MAARSIISKQTFFQKVLALFPEEISYAFAYGSGVFIQDGQKNPMDNMVDFIFVVDNPTAWHTSNIKSNRSHYSVLKYGGSKLINNIQNNYGAGIYYNTLIPFETGLIKYGIVSTQRFTDDLLDWETLYLSGRLHKPVHVIKDNQSPEITKALDINLHSAIYASLLNLPEKFSEKELYLKIASLSYQGDFRMLVGEDKNKVKKIVEPQLINFNNIYKPLLINMPGINWNNSNNEIEQECCINTRLHYLNLLPRAVQQRLVAKWNKDGRYRDMEDILRAIAHELDCGKIVSSVVSDIVWSSSWSQSIKGILTAGITKSIRYGGKKIFKMIKGMRKKSDLN